jgi:pantetheine-phosphate adenylyltransferase
MTKRYDIAVYPGTFDPITNGHLDILERALHLVDRVIVTIATNVRKQPLFTVEERIGFIRDAFTHHADRLEYAQVDGLLVDFCKQRGAGVIVRGLRALADFEYEFQVAHMNRRLAPDVDTVFFMTDERNHYVSSSLVKEVASLGGNVDGLVPPMVVRALAQKYGNEPTKDNEKKP